MSPRISYLSLLTCALVALSLFTSGCSTKQSGPITEQQVKAFLEELDNAARNRDVDAVVDKLSADVQFKLTVEGFGPTQTITLNRDQYRDYGKQGYAQVEAYEYRRGETVIKVDPDGKSAFVADETFETTTMGGRVLRSVSRATSILKLENGKLVISRGEATVRPVTTAKAGTPVKF